MKGWGMLVLAVPILSMGCASGAATPAAGRLARSSAYLCKHCNCFMRADTDPDAVCPVCKCGHAARHCHREKS